ncbi:hypothetical protein [Streptomyces sp. WM4235]|uniref:hypothetical protein n=1 Tax=Streptomyces sp. WM4235 TaxID=1415551 RepID=UPI0006AF0FF8|nr:hypothetical protein [Streptomyces sp. WM4235]
MEEFIAAAFGFPAVVFTFALGVVVAYWLLVLLGAAEHDTLDTDSGSAALGTAGVPFSVSVSMFTAFAWFTALAGTVYLDRAGLGGGTAVPVLLAALIVARVATRICVAPLRGFFQPDEPPPSRQDFIGLVCVIRTGRVDDRFGQAEVAAADGSTAIVQVRQTGDDPLSHGSAGLLYAYDEPGEFFWVAPYDSALDPRA